MFQKTRTNPGIPRPPPRPATRYSLSAMDPFDGKELVLESGSWAFSAEDRSQQFFVLKTDREPSTLMKYPTLSLESVDGTRIEIMQNPATLPIFMVSITDGSGKPPTVHVLQGGPLWPAQQPSLPFEVVLQRQGSSFQAVLVFRDTRITLKPQKGPRVHVWVRGRNVAPELVLEKVK